MLTVPIAFYVRDRKFFHEGKVFAVIFSETAGSTATSYNSSLSEARFSGHYVHTQSRRFVVVRQKREFCYACPIYTYSNRATTKRGVRPEEHGIAYSKGQEPKLVPGEEGINKRPIAVAMAQDVSALHIASRIYYGIHHPIRYNVKVKDIGLVLSDHLPALIGNWKAEDAGETRQAAEVTAAAEEPELPHLPEEIEDKHGDVPQHPTSRKDPHMYDPKTNVYGYDAKINPHMYHPIHNQYGYHPKNNTHGFHPQSNRCSYHPEHNPHGYHPQKAPFCYHPQFSTFGFHGQLNINGYHPDVTPFNYHPQSNYGGYHPEHNAHGYHPQHNIFGYHPDHNPHGYHPVNNAYGYHADNNTYGYHPQHNQYGYHPTQNPNAYNPTWNPQGHYSGKVRGLDSLYDDDTAASENVEDNKKPEENAGPVEIARSENKTYGIADDGDSGRATANEGAKGKCNDTNEANTERKEEDRANVTEVTPFEGHKEEEDEGKRKEK
jgi:hypothetical protein